MANGKYLKIDEYIKNAQSNAALVSGANGARVPLDMASILEFGDKLESYALILGNSLVDDKILLTDVNILKASGDLMKQLNNIDYYLNDVLKLKSPALDPKDAQDFYSILNDVAVGMLQLLTKGSRPQTAADIKEMAALKAKAVAIQKKMISNNIISKNPSLNKSVLPTTYKDKNNTNKISTGKVFGNLKKAITSKNASYTGDLNTARLATQQATDTIVAEYFKGFAETVNSSLKREGKGFTTPREDIVSDLNAATGEMLLNITKELSGKNNLTSSVTKDKLAKTAALSFILAAKQRDQLYEQIQKGTLSDEDYVKQVKPLIDQYVKLFVTGGKGGNKKFKDPAAASRQLQDTLEKQFGYNGANLARQDLELELLLVDMAANKGNKYKAAPSQKRGVGFIPSGEKFIKNFGYLSRGSALVSSLQGIYSAHDSYFLNPKRYNQEKEKILKRYGVTERDIEKSLPNMGVYDMVPVIAKKISSVNTGGITRMTRDERDTLFRGAGVEKAYQMLGNASNQKMIEGLLKQISSVRNLPLQQLKSLGKNAMVLDIENDYVEGLSTKEEQKKSIENNKMLTVAYSKFDDAALKWQTSYAYYNRRYKNSDGDFLNAQLNAEKNADALLQALMHEGLSAREGLAADWGLTSDDLKNLATNKKMQTDLLNKFTQFYKGEGKFYEGNNSANAQLKLIGAETLRDAISGYNLYGANIKGHDMKLILNELLAELGRGYKLNNNYTEIFDIGGLKSTERMKYFKGLGAELLETIFMPSGNTIAHHARADVEAERELAQRMFSNQDTIPYVMNTIATLAENSYRELTGRHATSTNLATGQSFYQKDFKAYGEYFMKYISGWAANNYQLNGISPFTGDFDPTLTSSSDMAKLIFGSNLKELTDEINKNYQSHAKYLSGKAHSKRISNISKKVDSQLEKLLPKGAPLDLIKDYFYWGTDNDRYISIDAVDNNGNLDLIFRSSKIRENDPKFDYSKDPNVVQFAWTLPNENSMTNSRNITSTAPLLPNFITGRWEDVSYHELASLVGVAKRYLEIGQDDPTKEIDPMEINKKLGRIKSDARMSMAVNYAGKHDEETSYYENLPGDWKKATAAERKYYMQYGRMAPSIRNFLNADPRRIEHIINNWGEAGKDLEKLVYYNNMTGKKNISDIPTSVLFPFALAYKLASNVNNQEDVIKGAGGSSNFLDLAQNKSGLFDKFWTSVWDWKTNDMLYSSSLVSPLAKLNGAFIAGADHGFTEGDVLKEILGGSIFEYVSKNRPKTSIATPTTTDKLYAEAVAKGLLVKNPLYDNDGEGIYSEKGRYMDEEFLIELKKQTGTRIAKEKLKADGITNMKDPRAQAVLKNLALPGVSEEVYSMNEKLIPYKSYKGLNKTVSGRVDEFSDHIMEAINFTQLNRDYLNDVYNKETGKDIDDLYNLSNRELLLVLSTLKQSTITFNNDALTKLHTEKDILLTKNATIPKGATLTSVTMLDGVLSFGWAPIETLKEGQKVADIIGGLRGSVNFHNDEDVAKTFRALRTKYKNDDAKIAELNRMEKRIADTNTTSFLPMPKIDKLGDVRTVANSLLGLFLRAVYELNNTYKIKDQKSFNAARTAIKAQLPQQYSDMFDRFFKFDKSLNKMTLGIHWGTKENGMVDSFGKAFYKGDISKEDLELAAYLMLPSEMKYATSPAPKNKTKLAEWENNAKVLRAFITDLARAAGINENDIGREFLATSIGTAIQEYSETSGYGLDSLIMLKGKSGVRFTARSIGAQLDKMDDLEQIIKNHNENKLDKKVWDALPDTVKNLTLDDIEAGRKAFIQSFYRDNSSKEKIKTASTVAGNKVQTNLIGRPVDKIAELVLGGATGDNQIDLSAILDKFASTKPMADQYASTDWKQLYLDESDWYKAIANEIRALVYDKTKKVLGNNVLARLTVNSGKNGLLKANGEFDVLSSNGLMLGFAPKGYDLNDKDLSLDNFDRESLRFIIDKVLPAINGTLPKDTPKKYGTQAEYNYRKIFEELLATGGDTFKNAVGAPRSASMNFKAAPLLNGSKFNAPVISYEAAKRIYGLGLTGGKVPYKAHISDLLGELKSLNDNNNTALNAEEQKLLSMLEGDFASLQQRKGHNAKQNSNAWGELDDRVLKFFLDTMSSVGDNGMNRLVKGMYTRNPILMQLNLLNGVRINSKYAPLDAQTMYLPPAIADLIKGDFDGDIILFMSLYNGNQAYAKLIDGMMGIDLTYIQDRQTAMLKEKAEKDEKYKGLNNTQKHLAMAAELRTTLMDSSNLVTNPERRSTADDAREIQPNLGLLSKARSNALDEIKYILRANNIEKDPAKKEFNDEYNKGLYDYFRAWSLDAEQVVISSKKKNKLINTEKGWNLDAEAKLVDLIYNPSSIDKDTWTEVMQDYNLDKSNRFTDLMKARFKYYSPEVRKLLEETLLTNKGNFSLEKLYERMTPLLDQAQEGKFGKTAYDPSNPTNAEALYGSHNSIAKLIGVLVGGHAPYSQAVRKSVEEFDKWLDANALLISQMEGEGQVVGNEANPALESHNDVLTTAVKLEQEKAAAALKVLAEVGKEGEAMQAAGDKTQAAGDQMSEATKKAQEAAASMNNSSGVDSMNLFLGSVIGAYDAVSKLLEAINSYNGKTILTKSFETSGRARTQNGKSGGNNALVYDEKGNKQSQRIEHFLPKNARNVKYNASEMLGKMYVPSPANIEDKFILDRAEKGILNPSNWDDKKLYSVSLTPRGTIAHKVREIVGKHSGTKTVDELLANDEWLKIWNLNYKEATEDKDFVSALALLNGIYNAGAPAYEVGDLFEEGFERSPLGMRLGLRSLVTDTMQATNSLNVSNLRFIPGAQELTTATTIFTEPNHGKEVGVDFTSILDNLSIGQDKTTNDLKLFNFDYKTNDPSMGNFVQGIVQELSIRSSLQNKEGEVYKKVFNQLNKPKKDGGYGLKKDAANKLIEQWATLEDPLTIFAGNSQFRTVLSKSRLFKGGHGVENLSKFLLAANQFIGEGYKVEDYKALEQVLSSFGVMNPELVYRNPYQSLYTYLAKSTLNKKTWKEAQGVINETQADIDRAKATGEYDENVGIWQQKIALVQQMQELQGSLVLTEADRAVLLKEETALLAAQVKQTGALNRVGKLSAGFLTKLKSGIKYRMDYMLGTGLAFKLINSVTLSIRKLITYVTTLDKKLVNLLIAIGGTREETQALILKYNVVALTLGKTTSEVADAANSWYRSGYRGQEAVELTTQSIKLSTLGMIESAQATTYLISTMKGWGLTVSEVGDVVDKLVTIDMNAAISAGELANAMSYANNAARTAGVNMNDYIGMITTVKDTTQKSAETVGTAFKTIFSRFGNVKAGKFVASYADMTSDTYSEENFTALNDIETVLDRVGIKVRKTATQWRDLDEVMGEIGSKWAGWDQTTQNAIATAIGGTRQREIVVSLFENWDSVSTYSDLAANSQGNADKKMLAYTDSVEAAKNRLTASFEGVSAAGLGLANTFTKIINVAANIVGTFKDFRTALAALAPVILTLAMVKKGGLYNLGSGIATRGGNVLSGLTPSGRPGLLSKISGKYTTQQLVAQVQDYLARGLLAGLDAELIKTGSSLIEGINKLELGRAGYRSVYNALRTGNVGAVMLNSDLVKMLALTAEAGRLTNAIGVIGKSIAVSEDFYGKVKDVAIGKAEANSLTEAEIKLLLQIVAKQGGFGGKGDKPFKATTGTIVGGDVGRFAAGVGSMFGMAMAPVAGATLGKEMAKSLNIEEGSASTIGSTIGGALGYGLAMSGPVGMGISAGLGVITAVVDIYKKGQEKIIKQLAEDLSKTSQQVGSAKTIKNLGDKFDDLADGVDSLGRNVSLSDEEYKDFLNLSNLIGEVFPELVTRIDESGNKIIELGNNAKTTADKLNEMYNGLLISEAYDATREELVTDTIKTVKDDYDKVIRDLEGYNPAIGFSQNSTYADFMKYEATLIKNGTINASLIKGMDKLDLLSDRIRAFYLSLVESGSYITETQLGDLKEYDKVFALAEQNLLNAQSSLWQLMGENKYNNYIEGLSKELYQVLTGLSYDLGVWMDLVGELASEYRGNKLYDNWYGYISSAQEQLGYIRAQTAEEGDGYAPTGTSALQGMYNSIGIWEAPTATDIDNKGNGMVEIDGETYKLSAIKRMWQATQSELSAAANKLRTVYLKMDTATYGYLTLERGLNEKTIEVQTFYKNLMSGVSPLKNGTLMTEDEFRNTVLEQYDILYDIFGENEGLINVALQASEATTVTEEGNLREELRNKIDTILEEAGIRKKNNNSYIYDFAGKESFQLLLNTSLGFLLDETKQKLIDNTAYDYLIKDALTNQMAANNLSYIDGKTGQEFGLELYDRYNIANRTIDEANLILSILSESAFYKTNTGTIRSYTKDEMNRAIESEYSSSTTPWKATAYREKVENYIGKWTDSTTGGHGQLLLEFYQDLTKYDVSSLDEVKALLSSMIGINFSELTGSAKKAVKMGAENIVESIRMGMTGEELGKKIAEQISSVTTSVVNDYYTAVENEAKALVAKNYSKLDSNTNGLIDTYEELANVLSKVTTAYQNLTKAQTEQASAGSVSMDTVFAMAEENSDYLLAYDFIGNMAILRSDADKIISNITTNTLTKNMEAQINSVDNQIKTLMDLWADYDVLLSLTTEQAQEKANLAELITLLQKKKSLYQYELQYYKDVNKYSGKLLDTYEKMNSVMQGISSSFSSLREAIKELKSKGFISVETALEMLSSNPELYNALDENALKNDKIFKLKSTDLDTMYEIAFNSTLKNLGYDVGTTFQETQSKIFDNAVLLTNFLKSNVSDTYTSIDQNGELGKKAGWFHLFKDEDYITDELGRKALDFSNPHVLKILADHLNESIVVTTEWSEISGVTQEAIDSAAEKIATGVLDSIEGNISTYRRTSSDYDHYYVEAVLVGSTEERYKNTGLVYDNATGYYRYGNGSGYYSGGLFYSSQDQKWYLADNQGYLRDLSGKFITEETKDSAGFDRPEVSKSIEEANALLDTMIGKESEVDQAATDSANTQINANYQVNLTLATLLGLLQSIAGVYQAIASENYDGALKFNTDQLVNKAKGLVDEPVEVTVIGSNQNNLSQTSTETNAASSNGDKNVDINKNGTTLSVLGESIGGLAEGGKNNALIYNVGGAFGSGIGDRGTGVTDTGSGDYTELDRLKDMIASLNKEYEQMKSLEAGNTTMATTSARMSELYYGLKRTYIQKEIAELEKLKAKYGESDKEYWQYTKDLKDAYIELNNIDDEEVQDKITILETTKASTTALKKQYQELLKTADTYQEKVEYQQKLNDAIVKELEMTGLLIDAQQQLVDLKLQYTTIGENGYENLISESIENAKNSLENAKEILSTIYDQTYTANIKNGLTESEARQAADEAVADQTSKVISAYQKYSEALFKKILDVTDKFTERLNQTDKKKPEQWSNESDIEKYYAERRAIAKETYDEIYKILGNASERAKYTDEQIKKMIDTANEALDIINNKIDELQDKITLGNERYSAITNTVNTYISELEKQKEVMEDYYDTEIEKLQDKLTNIERTNKLIELQNNLLDAQQEKERVYKEGIGWTYSPNRAKQKEAQKAIDDFNLQDNIDDLQNAKEAESEALQKSIDNWNDYLLMLEYNYKEYERIEDARTLRELLLVDTDEQVYQMMLDDQINFTNTSEEMWKNHNSTMESVYGGYTSIYSNFIEEFKNLNLELAEAKRQQKSILEYEDYTSGNDLDEDDLFETNGKESYDYEDLNTKYMNGAVEKQGAGGYTEGWNKTGDKSWYASSDNTYYKGGWQEINGKYYYFDDEGYVRDTSTGAYSRSGISEKLWEEIDYDLNNVTTNSAKNKLAWIMKLADPSIADPYFANAANTLTKGAGGYSKKYLNGASSGWVKEGDKWWYATGDNTYSSGGWQNIGGKYYEFDENGYLVQDSAHNGDQGVDQKQYEKLNKATQSQVDTTKKSTTSTKALTSEVIKSYQINQEGTLQAVTNTNRIIDLTEISTEQLTTSNGELIGSNNLMIDSNGNLYDKTNEDVIITGKLIDSEGNLITSNSLLAAALGSYQVAYSKEKDSEAASTKTWNADKNYSVGWVKSETTGKWWYSTGGNGYLANGYTPDGYKVDSSGYWDGEDADFDHVSFATGIENGPVEYTGLAMLHGSPTSPEFVLNSEQAYNLLRYISTKANPNDEINNFSKESINEFGHYLSELSSLKYLSNNLSSANTGTTYNLSGDIVLENCNDPAQFWSDVTRAMNNRFSVTRKS